MMGKMKRELLGLERLLNRREYMFCKQEVVILVPNDPLSTARSSACACIVACARSSP